MSITVEQINLWRQLPSETQNLEFKEAKTQYDTKKLSRYCVAIANEGGGHLILGVKDKLPREVVGTQAFNDVVDIAGKLFTWVGFRVDIEEINHPDGRILVFIIPPRPRGTAYHYEGAYLMRSGEELVPMSEDQLRKIFAEGQPNWLEEIALKNISAQDVVHLLDTQTFFELLNLPYPTDQSGVIGKLISEKLIEKTDVGFNILNIGAILLAKNLKNFSHIQRKATRVIVYKGESKLETLSDLTGEKGYAVGFIGLVQYVMGKLPQNEIIKNAIRKEVKLVPEVVIRELLANALIHQDFEMTGASPVVEVFSNRIEISNPGEPIVPVERFIDGYQSRNERLADIMRRFGICEEKSSGIDRVIESAEILQLPAPEFLISHKRTIVVIHGEKAFRDMSGSDRIRACYQHCVLQYVLRKQMTNQSLRQRFGVSEGSANIISQIISSAVEQNLIKNDPNAPDSRRYARYIPFWA
ncbi:putative DNA binding domain-containing protein [Acinetobacter sp. SCLZS86]|uniref:ATP-binding protein n=1 Tax=Acinetobacter TaxID=469 RepID=UPI0015B38095|nr:MULTISPECIES: ATP-binding protein [Acinetobacter]MBT0888458.1 putative DNA binding domain-containing protein [Acinetobacter towneri]NWJ93862.1 putative DNA binding domain-containing protein [Acinetobacter sp. Swhac1]UIZ57178.1 putative DNA binding domain-containing protein [Acinetobacter sp. SCLZS86]